MSLDAASTKADSLAAILLELRESSEIIASLILTLDGLVISSDIPAHMNDDMKVAAILGMVTKTAQKSIDQLGHGPLECVILKIHEGHIIIMNAGPRALLATFTGDDAHTSIVKMKIASKKIEEYI